MYDVQHALMCAPSTLGRARRSCSSQLLQRAVDRDAPVCSEAPTRPPALCPTQPGASQRVIVIVVIQVVDVVVVIVIIVG